MRSHFNLRVVYTGLTFWLIAARVLAFRGVGGEPHSSLRHEQANFRSSPYDKSSSIRHSAHRDSFISVDAPPVCTSMGKPPTLFVFLSVNACSRLTSPTHPAGVSHFRSNKPLKRLVQKATIF